ncbi:Cupin domain [Seminavis robusta]|uniref:Cupin domain n=1 Tax=Seminavis robusta TaxID=568900 RepID=A0A9N8ELA3_9STRA|nr:Cupin domain [Seminavis robusta]|eukprot:Sro1118_g243100.1 Cupin domain (230) ;mRNA; f:16461-17150
MPGWLIVTSWVAAALSFLILPEQQALAYSATCWCKRGHHHQDPAHKMTRGPKSARKWGVVEPVLGAHGLFRVFFQDDGTFPNNPDHPVMMAKDAFRGSDQEARHLLQQAAWTSPWKWGIFPYHHYHSTAWELLLCVQGQADILLGGDVTGTMVTIHKGDVMLIPPGVVHKQMREQGGFALLGSYPKEGCSGPVDTVTKKPNQQERQNILDCVAPTFSPILEIDLMQFYQ